MDRPIGASTGTGATALHRARHSALLSVIQSQGHTVLHSLARARVATVGYFVAIVVRGGADATRRRGSPSQHRRARVYFYWANATSRRRWWSGRVVGDFGTMSASSGMCAGGGRGAAQDKQASPRERTLVTWLGGWGISQAEGESPVSKSSAAARCRLSCCCSFPCEKCL